jgi:hypothetical protein
MLWEHEEEDTNRIHDEDEETKKDSRSLLQETFFFLPSHGNEDSSLTHPRIRRKPRQRNQRRMRLGSQPSSSPFSPNLETAFFKREYNFISVFGSTRETVKGNAL